MQFFPEKTLAHPKPRHLIAEKKEACKKDRSSRVRIVQSTLCKKETDVGMKGIYKGHRLTGRETELTKRNDLEFNREKPFPWLCREINGGGSRGGGKSYL